jgi:hypothetical protein
MKQLFYTVYLLLFFFLTSCNLIKHHQTKLDKKFAKAFDKTTYFSFNNDKIFCQYSISDTSKPYVLFLHGFGVNG